jgi:hypothetical protein
LDFDSSQGAALEQTSSKTQYIKVSIAVPQEKCCPPQNRAAATKANRTTTIGFVEASRPYALGAESAGLNSN